MPGRYAVYGRLKRRLVPKPMSYPTNGTANAGNTWYTHYSHPGSNGRACVLDRLAYDAGKGEAFVQAFLSDRLGLGKRQDRGYNGRHPGEEGPGGRDAETNLSDPKKNQRRIERESQGGRLFEESGAVIHGGGGGFERGKIRSAHQTRVKSWPSHVSPVKKVLKYAVTRPPVAKASIL